MVLPLLAAVAPALIGGIASAWGTHAANQEAKEASQKQMDFQKETLRHQYQWGMEDMKKAGLNPILAYKQGGAGSAGGSSYTPQNVGSAAVSGASTATSSALASRAQEIQLENIKADTALKQEQDKTQAALQIQAVAQAGQAGASSALMRQQALSEWHRTGIEFENLKIARGNSAKSQADERLYETEFGKIVRNLGTMGKDLNPFLPSKAF